MNKVVFTFLLFFWIITVLGQVSGIVTDEFDFPIEGAEVENVSQNISTVTDANGFYEIQAVPGDILQITSLTGVEQQQTVGATSEINIKMGSAITLTDVVAIGYGTVEKELVSAAVSTIEAEDLTENNPVRIDQALQGKTSGVQVTSSSGSPGSGYNIRIRGVTTNGDNSPLVIVDGVNIGTDIGVIDPNDIASVDIIKDAATAIYGVQGANGVILITTKSGRFNKAPEFTYNAYYAIQETQKMLDLMDAREYAIYTNETFLANGGIAPYPDFETYGNGTNWQAELFQLAPMFSHNIGVTGGSDAISYGFSGNFLQQDGIIAPDKSNYQRWVLRNTLGIKLTDKLRLNTLLNYTNVQRQTIAESGRGGALYYAYNASPLSSVYDGNDPGSISGGFNYLETQGIELINPLALIHNTFNKTNVDRFTGKIELEYELLTDLTATSRYNFNYAKVGNRTFNPLVYYGPGKVQNNVTVADNGFVLDTNNNGVRDMYSTVGENNQHYYDYTWESFVNYDFDISDSHNFETLLGVSLRSEQGEGLYGQGFLTTGAESWENAFLYNTVSILNDPYLHLETDSDGNVTLVDDSVIKSFNSASFNTEDRWFSLFGRIQYDFQQKYLLSAMLRRDASSRFGPNNRVGYFPSFSAGWVLSKESFFTNDFFDFLKIRGSWGITGNDKIGAYRWLGLLQGGAAEANYPFDDILAIGNALGALSNPDLKWETNYQTNIGFDATLGRNVDLAFDYYIKKTEDLLLIPDVSALLGALAGGSSAPFVNAGTVENRGIDFSFSWDPQISENFGLNFSYNLTTIDNEVIEVNNESGFLTGGLFSLNQPTSRMQGGMPLGAFYGLRAEGIFQNQAEIDAHAAQSGALPGDIRYADIDGDGVVEFGSEDDLTMIGNPIPDMLMGLNVGANYKGFDAAISLYASIGNEIVRSYERFLPYSNRLDYYLQRWTGEGTSTEVPRASTNAANNYLFSSFYVEDGSYLRIQNAQLGYTFPSDWLSVAGIENLRLYFSVNNVYTFTKYMGYDPDISNASPIGAGVDQGQYPQTRTFMTGINITF